MSWIFTLLSPFSPPFPLSLSRYGVSEFAQAFCRFAAVNGSLYLLRQPVSSLLLSKEEGKEGEVAGVELGEGGIGGEGEGGERGIKAPMVVTSPHYLPKELFDKVVRETGWFYDHLFILLFFHPSPFPLFLLSLL